jgi:beta-lactamase regulating signal transducer with metallopeptidase domain
MIGTGADLLDALLKATAILALGLAASRFAAHARASIRHLILAATFGALVALPLTALVVPRVIVRVPVPRSGTAVALAPGLTPDSPGVAERRAQPAQSSSGMSSIVSLSDVFFWTWSAGAVLVCASLLLAFWRIRWIRRHGLPRPDLRPLAQAMADEAGIRRPIEVLEHERVAAPLTCGVWRPAIVLPRDARDWDDANVRRALVHELEHVKRTDWAIQLAARVVCAAYWFHPLAWMAWRGLCLEAERACDDAVLRSAERTDYADQLVLLAQRLSQAHAPAMLGMANRSDLATRVTALLDDRQRRGRAGLIAAVTVLGAAAVIVVALAPVRAVAAPPEQTMRAALEQTPRRGNTQRRPRGLDRALYEAAESGDIAEIDQLLQAGADVNAAIDGDGSPLIAAARRRRLEVVRHLLDRGADANMPVPGDGSPIIAAAKEGATAVVALLLDRGAEIDRMVPEDENALIQASERGRLEVVRLLIARGADVNARAWAEGARERPGGEWRTPLSMARRGGHADVVSALVAAGARE